MAAPAVARSYGPPLCPSFAEVCSFLERYGAALDLPEMTFPQMERYLGDTTAVPKPLVELHVKLLRKLGRSVTTDRWEKYLAKVCQELNSTWAWELEQKGYQEMSMECKSSILKYLCECQFDDNLKFKMVVNEEEPEKMRLQPVGRDQQGLMYWLQLDQEQNIRLYTEEQDDLDGSTWKCIVRTRNDLAEALELLKAQIESNQGQDQDQTQIQNQAGSRSTSPAEKDTANEDFKNTKLLKTSAEQNDKKKTGPAMEKKPIKQDIKEEENAESKMEEKSDCKLAAFDNRVSTITAIKSEHRDADGPKNAVSVLMSPSVSLVKINREDEAEQAAVRCNQQAKIPLKKRDLKLAGCFHTNHLNNTNSSSSIIVCNPSVINAKDCRGRDGKLQNSSAPQGSPGSSLQQQQPVVSASRQELTNGRASHLPPKEGHNGVIGQVGVVSHVGVIRSPSEHHRAPGAEHREENGPKSEPRGLRAAEEGNEVSRQSVLVRKGQADQETTQTASALPTRAITSLKPQVIVRKVDSLSFSSLTTTETGRKVEGDRSTKTSERTAEDRSQQEEGGPEESREETRVKEEPGTNSGTSGEADCETGAAVSPQNADRLNIKDQQGQGLNGGLVSVVKLKKIGFVSEQKREEASSELQKEGIRLKIKIPPHRRNKLRRKEGKEEMKNREQEVQKEARALRRSARICRSSALPNCRPSSKVAESQKKKPQNKETPAVKTREEEEADEEEEDDDDDDEGQSSASTKNQKNEPAGKFNKRKGKRRHGRPRWTNVRPKRHKQNEEGEAEDRGRKRGEREEKGGSASEEEFCKSEEIPAEDACTHCGLPNHPELILLCDLCDRGYHTACLRPPLMLIPDGEWFCPPCQHKMLCEKLEEQLQNLDSALKKKERAERRRERLVYVGISVENIIPEGDGEEGEEEKSAKKKDPKKTKNLGRRSTRTRKHISYRFDDFDDAIDEAIEEDVRDIGSGAETGKETPPVLSGAVKENQRPARTQSRAARNRKKRRLNDLESDSTAIESEEEFMLSNSSEEEDFAASGPDDGEDEDAGSDGGSVDAGARPRRGLRRGPPKYKPRRTERRGRKRRRRRSSEEEEDEESDVEMDSDQFSDMTDSEADKKRRGLRRGQRQQVNYRETSESSDNSRTSTKREQVKRRGRPRKERFSSDYSDVSASSRDSEEDYDDEEEDGRRRVDRRRRRGEQEELRGSRTREKRKRHENEDGRRRLKRRQVRKADDDEDGDRRRSSSARTDRDKEDPERMGRGRRREMLSQQRRKLLAQMLKKRRPSTEDEDESDESDDSQSSSGDDRPIRKRLNRIDSDDEEDEKYVDSDDDKGQKMSGRKSSEQRDDDKNGGGAQEKRRGRSPSPSDRLQKSRDAPKPRAGSPSAGGDGGAGSGRRERHNGPTVHPAAEDDEDEEEEEEEGGQSDSLNSVQNSPQS